MRNADLQLQYFSTYQYYDKVLAEDGDDNTYRAGHGDPVQASPERILIRGMFVPIPIPIPMSDSKLRLALNGYIVDYYSN